MKNSLIASEYNRSKCQPVIVTKAVLRFMQLMRQLRDREVEVAGSNMVSSMCSLELPLL